MYDGVKNLLLIPLLLWVRTSHRPGRTAAHFVFWYAFLRVFIDLFRDYPTHRLALGTGQTLNLLMALVGVFLLVRSYFWTRAASSDAAAPAGGITPRIDEGSVRWKRAMLAALLLFSLTIPSNWTQDVPRRYGTRHPGLRNSALYPVLTAPITNRPAPRPDHPYELFTNLCSSTADSLNCGEVRLRSNVLPQLFER
jgi:hypothetical protein